MTKPSANVIRVLAIDPTTRGFGFAVLEGPDRLVDWGVKTVKQDKHAGCLVKVREIIALYQPTVLVIENAQGQGSRRCARVRQLLDGIRDLGVEETIRTRMFSRTQVGKALAANGGATKHEIAVAVTKRLPELARLLPPVRRPWMSEDYRMSVFDAVALAATHFCVKARRTPAITISGQQVRGSREQ